MILIQDFTKSFGGIRVVDELSFEVPAGSTFGFLGANGSGKTTTIRALLGAIRPDAGQLLVDGAPYTPERSHMLGYLPEQRGIYPKERVLDVMTYFGKLRGLSGSAASRSCTNLLERVGLADKAKARIKTLSGGELQKVQLALTMINDPELLILDEPTKALDPVNRNLLLEFVEERAAAGATVVLVSHRMEDVERLCERALILRHGRAVASGTVAELRASQHPRRYRVRVSGDRVDIAGMQADKTADGDWLLTTEDSGLRSDEVLGRLVTAGVRVESFQEHLPTLEDVFIAVHSAEEQGAA